MSEKNPYQKFCIYIEKIEKLGIGYSIGELYQKAMELRIKPPKEFRK